MYSIGVAADRDAMSDEFRLVQGDRAHCLRFDRGVIVIVNNDRFSGRS